LEFFRERQQAAVDLVQFRQVVVLNFKEKAVPSKKVQVPAQRAFSLFGVALQKGAREFAGKAGRTGNQASA
jgi:hypothetical protein